MIKKVVQIGFPVFLVVLLFSLRSVGAYLGSHPSIPQEKEIVNVNLDENKLMNLVQAWRVKNNLPEYTKSIKTCGVASIRLDEVSNDFSHDSFLKRSKQEDYWGYNHVGENLAKDHRSENLMLDAWLNSASHEANLKDNYTESCIRCSGSTCVQIFAGY